MPENDPKMPKTQTSAPVSREEPKDVTDRDRRPSRAESEHRAARADDAAGGDRGIDE